MKQVLGLLGDTEVHRIAVRGIDSAIDQAQSIFVELSGLLRTEMEEAVQAPQKVKLKRLVGAFALFDWREHTLSVLPQSSNVLWSRWVARFTLSIATVLRRDKTR